MFKNFRSYQLAVQFFNHCKKTTLKNELKNQLLRASSSIALNLAEGIGRRTALDRKKFFQIAFGSIRECQAIMDLYPEKFSPEMKDTLDHIAASTFKLIRFMTT